jgi:dinuclear metal center YbgI/SA1388 family protein
MPTVADVADYLEVFAPAALAEDWDNVGLLVGDRSRSVARIMTCLTITPASAAEAIAEQADLIVTHHPLPFKALKRLTADSHEGQLLWDLIGARVSIYSPHTAFDSAREGINQRLAEGLGLTQTEPLVPSAVSETPPVGAGRWGTLASPITLAELAQRVKDFLALSGLHVVGDATIAITKVAVACGSAGEFLRTAQQIGCEVLVTGETRFHTCLEAEAAGINLLLPGHFASERFGVERLADVLARQFPQAQTWASRREQDPLRWI